MKAAVIFLKNQALSQFIKFCIIGASNALVHLGIYYFLIWINVNYLIANICAFILSVLNSYFWNRKFTFKKTAPTVFMIVRLYASYGATTLLGTGLLYLFVEVIGLGKYISPLINIGITTSINFALNKYFVFKDME